MPTANHSPILGLMLPQDTDPFGPDDFDATFGILDARPGIRPVANYASLPAGLTSAQHGLQFIQMDNTAQWIWYMPSSGTPGSWKRTNSVGVLTQGAQVGGLNTTSTSPVTVMTAPTVICPGGRGVMTLLTMPLANSSGQNGIVIAGLYLNGNYATGANFKPGFAINGGNALQTMSYLLPMTTPGQTLSFRLTIASALGAVANGALGTSTCGGAIISIFEV